MEGTAGTTVGGGVAGECSDGDVVVSEVKGSDMVCAIAVECSDCDVGVSEVGVE